jgi:FkbM family methyltransferase
MKKFLHNALKYYLRYFPITRGKGALFSRLWKPLSFGQYRRQTTLRQAHVRLDCDLTKFLQRHLYFFGGYEADYCGYWIKLARRSSTIFDIGANLGLYSLLAAAVNPLAHIHAFEPAPELVETFAGNLRLNNIRNVIVNANAVGNYCGNGALQRIMGGDDIYDGMSFMAGAAPENSASVTAVVTLDDYCRQNQIARIDLLKLDIEGWEYEALLGAEALLQAQAIGCLFVELVESHANRSGHSTVEIKRLLLDAGYQIYELRAGKLAALHPEKVHHGTSDNMIAFAPNYNYSDVAQERQNDFGQND